MATVKKTQKEKKQTQIKKEPKPKKSRVASKEKIETGAASTSAAEDTKNKKKASGTSKAAGKKGKTATAGTTRKKAVKSTSTSASARKTKKTKAAVAVSKEQIKKDGAELLPAAQKDTSGKKPVPQKKISEETTKITAESNAGATAVLEPVKEPLPAVTTVTLEPEEKKEQYAAAQQQQPAVKPVIKIDETITVAALADKLKIKVSELIKKMLSLGIIATINQRIDTDVASIVASEFGYGIEVVSLYGDTTSEEKEDISKLKTRPPIVTIMGHVDHGKTSLLDAIRKTDVAGKEFGGITQHMGAYRVATSQGEIIFLDTPGHEAFTAMRARGAKVTDIVILIVAADDGVMPQTIEAIAHARAANTPIIVAINKIDVNGVNIQKVKQDLANQALVPEDWGGKTITVETSARKNIGIDKLLELILLQAEMMELKANPDKPAVGVIIEAKVSKGVGPVATVLIHGGTLRVGDSFIAGTTFGKVKAMSDDKKKKVLEAGPSVPVEVMGFQSLPLSGDRFIVVEDERKARHISETRREIKRGENFAIKKHLTLENFHKNFSEGKTKELKLIIKSDVRGSAEVLKDSLQKLDTKDVSVKIIHSGIGGINDSDIILAAASDAVIVGFNVKEETSAIALAQKENVDIKTYRIIYDVINDIKSAMEGLLDPDKKEVYLGRAKILKIFKVEKIGSIAGCLVIDGKISRTARARVLRDNIIVYDGKLYTLKRFKDDVKDVDKGFECGLTLDGFHDLKIGDIIESYSIEFVKRKL
ncbi:MAG: Translation initiation factor IF-2 [Elusimicrobia bacterium ADurb.Bin231]|nr:MAG: Translation initiation factor IF-2 [Elusimicrobia bacterium ADurb.Bin231]